ncbi:MAG: hypothetical protein H6899_12865 [Rhodobacter sp.]|nr:hypothetical protein [Paracoccaceae bacterium]MCC0080807.1 hypothetical protein [Rhodobacter sp.]
MSRRPRTAAQHVHSFFLKAIGWYGLMFVPILVFAMVAGLTRDDIPQPYVLVATAVALPVSLLLISDRGRPWFLLRPASLLSGIGAFLLVGLLFLPIVLQVVFTVLNFDLTVFFERAGIAAPSLEILADQVSMGQYLAAQAAGKDLTGVTIDSQALLGLSLVAATLALMPISVSSWIVSLMSLFVRYRDDTPRPAQTQRPVQDPDEARAERAAALRAMKIRMNRRAQMG